MNEIIKTYGLQGEWVLGSLVYSDSLPLIKTTDNSATLSATFTGTLKEAVDSAPPLGSFSDLLPDTLRCYRRNFSQSVNTVSITLTYAEYEDEKPTYTLSATPKSIPLLQHRRFRGKNITNNERVIAQEYVNGGTDSTVLFYKEEGEDIVVADSVPDAEKSKWTQATLQSLVKKYTPDSTAVKLARNGTKTLPSPALTWTEVKTSKLKPAVEGIGDRASPRGDNPTGHRWILSSIRAEEVASPDDDGTRYKVSTVWESDDYPEEED